MTSFVKENFHFFGDCLSYVVDPSEYRGKFVARFKYRKGGLASFKKFLIANFTVEEYFARLDEREAPLTILRSKGYVDPSLAKFRARLAA